MAFPTTHDNDGSTPLIVGISLEVTPAGVQYVYAGDGAWNVVPFAAASAAAPFTGNGQTTPFDIDFSLLGEDDTVAIANAIAGNTSAVTALGTAISADEEAVTAISDALSAGVDFAGAVAAGIAASLTATQAIAGGIAAQAGSGAAILAAIDFTGLTATQGTDITAKIDVATTVKKGAMSAADKTKIGTLETGATADLTGTEIRDLLDTLFGDTDWRN